MFAAQVERLDTRDGLLRAAVAMSMHELVDADFRAVDRALQGYADRVLARVPSGRPQALLAHLHDVLFDEERFTGNADDYYNPLNSYLPAVLDTRRGIPITLTLIYRDVAERVGLRVHGVNAPGHFLACVEMDDTPGGGVLLVDPYFKGRSMSGPEAFDRLERVVGQPVVRDETTLALASGTHWVARMLANLQNVFGQQERGDDLTAMVELSRLLQARST